MAFQFPWTNFHELNLDWFLSKFKQFTNNYLETTATVELISDTEQPEVTVTGGVLDDDTDIVDPFTFNFKLPVILSNAPVNSVNSQLPDASGNVALNGTDIPVSSTDSTTIKDAIDTKANTSDLSNYLPLAGGTMRGKEIFGVSVGGTTWIQGNVNGGSSATEDTYRDMIQMVNRDGNRVVAFRAFDRIGKNELFIMVNGESDTLVNAAQFSNANGIKTAQIYGALTIPSPPESDNSTLACTTAWAQREFKYKSGDVVNVGGGVFAGYFDSNKNLYFFIPLNKDMSNVTGASLTTDTSWTIYCAGSILVPNTTLASFGTVTCTKMETGILVKVVPSNTTSLTARETVSVRANTAKITLT